MCFPKFSGRLRATQVQLRLQRLELVEMLKAKQQQTDLGLTVNEMELCLLTRSNPLLEPSVRSVCLCFVPISRL